VVVDLETTGLDPRRDHIVSYGAVPIRHGRVLPAESVYGLVRVPREVPAEAVKCHSLRTQDLTGAPPLSACVTRLDALIGEHAVIAHGAWIERSFLCRAFRRCHRAFSSQLIDTAVLAGHVLAVPDHRGDVISLEYAATMLKLPVHAPHHALGDALTTAGLFLALTGHLERQRGGSLSTSTLCSLAG